MLMKCRDRFPAAHQPDILSAPRQLATQALRQRANISGVTLQFTSRFPDWSMREHNRTSKSARPVTVRHRPVKCGAPHDCHADRSHEGRKVYLGTEIWIQPVDAAAAVSDIAVQADGQVCAQAWRPALVDDYGLARRGRACFRRR